MSKCESGNGKSSEPILAMRAAASGSKRSRQSVHQPFERIYPVDIDVVLYAQGNSLTTPAAKIEDDWALCYAQTSDCIDHVTVVGRILRQPRHSGNIGRANLTSPIRSAF